jgi:hypothetical protein
MNSGTLQETKDQALLKLGRANYEKFVDQIVRFWEEGYGYEVFVVKEAQYQDHLVTRTIKVYASREDEELGERWPDGNGRKMDGAVVYEDVVVNEPKLVAPTEYGLRKGPKLCP